jgi:hypothetical protein
MLFVLVLLLRPDFWSSLYISTLPWTPFKYSDHLIALSFIALELLVEFGTASAKLTSYEEINTASFRNL